MKNGEVYGSYLVTILVVAILSVGLMHMLQGGEESRDSIVGNEKTDSGRTDGSSGENGNPDGTAGGNAGTQTSVNPTVRVVLMSTGYQEIVHPEVRIAASSGLHITYGGQTEEWQAGEVLTVRPDDARFAAGNIRVTAAGQGDEIQVYQIERGYGNPCYAGTLELRTTAEGIAMINELPLEDYLCKVVPSEMPASYEMEALKAQAVCARSYAYRQAASYGYPEYEAHMNDSTDYQVYNNSQPQDTAAAAVRETAGQVLLYQGQIAVTYYYSTSCGRTTDMEAWGDAVNESNAYLQSVAVCGDEGDYEKELPWYHWTAQVPVTTLSNLVGLNTGVDVGTLTSVEVTRRGAGDVALQIVASGDKGSVTVDTENKIRRALGGSGYTIVKNDGTAVGSTELLPSAFFTIEKSGEMFVIEGGGYGHGIGMSQNGANEMAKQGKGYQEILGLFYPGTELSAY